MRRSVTLLLLLAALAIPAFATNAVYIAQNATGADSGTSCANAKAYTYFNNPGNWSGIPSGIQIGPATTVHICGTITAPAGTTALSFQGSGSSGNAVILLFESGAIVQAPYFPPASGSSACGGGICATGRSWITIDGGSNGIVKNTANGTGLANHQSSELIDIHNCNSCMVQDVSLLDVYVRTSPTDTSIDETLMACIEFNGSNILITGNTINNAGWCLKDSYKNGDTNVEVAYNTLTNFAHGIMFAAAAPNAATNVYIHDNNFAGPGTTWDGSGCPFHQDGIHLFGVSGSSIDNFYFYNNYFHGDWGQCPTGWVFVEAAGSGTPANLRNSYWWNNVGVVNSSGQIVNTNGWFNVSQGLSGVQKFLNNTIIGPNSTDNTACLVIHGMSGVTVEDNAISSCGDPIDISSSTVVAADYNFYGPSCQNGNNCFIWNGAFTGSFANWKAACNCDAHSVQNNTSGLNSDGSPQIGSPVIGLGLNLTSLATGPLTSLSSDTTLGNTRNDIARPASGAWASGAYQFSGGGGSNFPYGSNCSGACGIGSNIITSSINIYLYDSNGSDPQIQASTSINGYTPASFPSTLDPTAMVFDWNTTTSSSGCVIAGQILNTTDRTICQTNGSGQYVIGTSHHVIVRHLVPAASNGTGGGPTTYYLASSTDGSTSNPGGTVLAANYGNGWSTYPGPQCINSGRACYFNVYSPNPAANLPIQWEVTAPGVQSAAPGYPTMLPLLLLWKNGNTTTTIGTSGLGPCGSGQTNYVGHLYNPASTPYSAPNSGTWYTCSGSAWVANASSPVWLMTAASVVKGANTYGTCTANANGGVDPTTHTPTGTCTGSAGDSGIALIPFYAGIFPLSSPSTYYRQIGLANGKYSFDMNGAAPPLNPQPTSVLEVFPAATSITGNITVNATFTLYTNAAATAIAAGTTPVTISYPLTIAAPTTLAASAPSPSVDANLPAYFAFNATSAANMFQAPGVTCSLAWWEQTISSTQWYPFGAGTFAECNTWNYDNARVATSLSDQFLHKMDGTAWPTSWAGTHTYGDAYANEVICPSSDTNGNCWVATNSACLASGSCGFTSGSGEPVWSSHGTVGNTVTDGGGSWINAGKRTTWNSYINRAQQPYLNNLVLTDGGVSQFSQFTGGLDQTRQRTGDAIAKSGGTTTGLYEQAERVAINGDFGGGAFNVFSTNAGRGAAYELDSLLTYWRTVCDAGNCSLFTADAAKQAVAFYDLNSGLNYLDFFSHQPQFSLTDQLAYGPVIVSFYTGLITESIIETIATCAELDPGSTLAICTDTRRIPYMKTFTGYAWSNWWNGSGTAGEGVNNYSFSYDPRDVQNHTIQEPFYTELTAPNEPALDWLYGYCGGDTVNCILPGAVHYDVAADQVRMHQYDGRNCSNWTCTGGTHFYGHPWSGGTGSPKMFGQANKWGAGNSYNWRLGYSLPTVTDLTPSRNPCWDSLTVPCTGSHPYADTMGPYPVQIIDPGNSGQDDPGAEGHFTGRSYSPIYSFDSTSAKIQFWTYEATVGCRVSYGANPTCNAGTVTTEDAGYPQSQSLAPVTTYLHHFTATGLTPNTPYYIKLQCTDAAGNTFSNSCSQQSQQGGGINFTTDNQTVLTVLTTTLPNGSVNTAYSSTLQAGGGIPPYTWAVTVGTLPSGLSLAGSTGIISGTPTVGGTSSFTVQVTDNVGTHATQPLSITVTDLTITTASLAGGTDGVPYSQTLAASGGTAPYTWAHIIGILPPGLSLDSATGIISGTPTACAAFPVTWKVTDSGSLTATKPLTITITGCTGAVTITTPLPLHNCVVNVACPNQQETATGGVAPYTWAVTAGSLPTSMTLDASTGILGGTPTVTGTFNFSVTATDSGAIASSPSAQSITVISTSQLGVTITGSTTITGNVTVGTPAP